MPEPSSPQEPYTGFITQSRVITALTFALAITAGWLFTVIINTMQNQRAGQEALLEAMTSNRNRIDAIDGQLDRHEELLDTLEERALEHLKEPHNAHTHNVGAKTR